MRRRVLGGVVALFWVVAWWLAFVPAEPGCPRPVGTMTNSGGPCALVSAGRLGMLGWWLVVTAGLSVAFLAMRRNPPTE